MSAGTDEFSGGRKWKTNFHDGNCPYRSPTYTTAAPGQVYPSFLRISIARTPSLSFWLQMAPSSSLWGPMDIYHCWCCNRRKISAFTPVMISALSITYPHMGMVDFVIYRGDALHRVSLPTDEWLTTADRESFQTASLLPAVMCCWWRTSLLPAVMVYIVR